MAGRDPALPATPLPQAALRSAGAAVGNALPGRDSAGESEFDQAPSGRKIVIARWQTPKAVRIIRQNHNRLDGQGVIDKRMSKRGAQGGEMTNQQVVTIPLRIAA